MAKLWLTMLPLVALADRVSYRSVHPSNVPADEVVPFGIVAIGCLVLGGGLIFGQMKHWTVAWRVMFVSLCLFLTCLALYGHRQFVCHSCDGHGYVKYEDQKQECQCCKGKKFHWTWGYRCVDNPTKVIRDDPPHRPFRDESSMDIR